MSGNPRSEWKWTAVEDEVGREDSHGERLARAARHARVLGIVAGPNGAAVVFDDDEVAGQVWVALN